MGSRVQVMSQTRPTSKRFWTPLWRTIPQAGRRSAASSDRPAGAPQSPQVATKVAVSLRLLLHKSEDKEEAKLPTHSVHAAVAGATLAHAGFGSKLRDDGTVRGDWSASQGVGRHRRELLARAKTALWHPDTVYTQAKAHNTRPGLKHGAVRRCLRQTGSGYMAGAWIMSVSGGRRDAVHTENIAGFQNGEREESPTRHRLLEIQRVPR